MATTEAKGDFPIRSTWGATLGSFNYGTSRVHTPRTQIYYTNNSDAISDAMRTWMFATVTPDTSTGTRLLMTGLGI